MDESLKELEAELKALRPQRPAPSLLDRIGCDLAGPGDKSTVSVDQRYTSATNLNSWKWLGWRTAGVAAAFALVVALSWLNLRPTYSPVSTPPQGRLAVVNPPEHTSSAHAARRDRYEPVAASNVLYEMKDEGPVYVDGDIPARRLRYRYLDTYTWKTPGNNASLKWSVPRDEIRVLPASLN